LVDLVPAEATLEIELFIECGLGILGKIEKQRFDVWSRRPVLTKWGKGVLLARALWRRCRFGSTRSRRVPVGAAHAASLRAE
jgi:hypothetical protein